MARNQELEITRTPSPIGYPFASHLLPRGVPARISVEGGSPTRYIALVGWLQRSPDDAYRSCTALLRRGLLSGGDVTELLGHFEGITGCVGLSVASGYRFATEDRLRNIDPEWPRAYAPHASSDPAQQFLDASGPFAVYSAAQTTTDWRSPLLRAFTRAGFADVAIMRFGHLTDTVLVAYRPRELGPFSALALERMSALLPLLEIAFAPSVVSDALQAPPDEANATALRRLGAYAILGKDEGSVSFSSGALRLLRSMFDGFGPRGQRRIERALRLGYRRFLARRGGRVIRLRSDLTGELALLPQPGHDASLLVVFSRRGWSADEERLPFAELLSPTQRLIAGRMAAGATIPAVAREIGVSGAAVKAHLREVYLRLGVASRAELAMIVRG